MADGSISEIVVVYSGALVEARIAFNLGETRYFTGKPCKYGHIDQRMISNGSCVRCLLERRSRGREDTYERTKVWRLTHPKARAEEARRYRAIHPDKVAAVQKRYYEKDIELSRTRAREGSARMRAANPEREKRARQAFQAREEAKRLAIAGRPRPASCELCGEDAKTVFDHCHATGAFRGWLCDRCNRTLGQVKDNTELLAKMIAYLEKSHGVLAD